MQLQRIQLATNEDKLILGWGSPGFGVDAAPLTAELKDMALFLSLEPENAFGPKDIHGHLGHQKVLEFGQIKGAIAPKRHRDKAILSEVGGCTVECLTLLCVQTQYRERG